MGQAAEDYADLQLRESLPYSEFNPRGYKTFAYVDEKGVKHRFDSLKEAQAWAERKGFKLTDKPPHDNHIDKR